MHLPEVVVPNAPRPPRMPQIILWRVYPGWLTAHRDRRAAASGTTVQRFRRWRRIRIGSHNHPLQSGALHVPAEHQAKTTLQLSYRQKPTPVCFPVSISSAFPHVVQSTRLPDPVGLPQSKRLKCRDTDEVDAGTRPVGALPHQSVGRSLHLFRERSRL